LGSSRHLRDTTATSHVTTGGTVARKRAAPRPSNVNRVLNDRLWDAEGAQWTRTAGEPSRARILELLADAAVPVGMHWYGEPLRWLHPPQRQQVWRAEIEPRLVSDTEPDAFPVRGGRRTEVFSPAEYRNQDGEPLLLFVALC
jgi:hypothetical protein